MTRLAFVLLLIATPAAAQSWNAGDRRAAGAAAVGIAGDCASSVVALNRGARELNPFLTARPGTFGILAGCAIGGATTWLVADALPRPWRRRLLLAIAVAGLALTFHNLRQ